MTCNVNGPLVLASRQLDGVKGTAGMGGAPPGDADHVALYLSVRRRRWSRSGEEYQRLTIVNTHGSVDVGQADHQSEESLSGRLQLALPQYPRV